MHSQRTFNKAANGGCAPEHARTACPVFPFNDGRGGGDCSVNALFCGGCVCFFCSTPATLCALWCENHCHACPAGAEWNALRQQAAWAVAAAHRPPSSEGNAKTDVHPPCTAPDPFSFTGAASAAAAAAAASAASRLTPAFGSKKAEAAAQPPAAQPPRKKSSRSAAPPPVRVGEALTLVPLGEEVGGVLHALPANEAFAPPSRPPRPVTVRALRSH